MSPDSSPEKRFLPNSIALLHTPNSNLCFDENKILHVLLILHRIDGMFDPSKELKSA